MNKLLFWFISTTYISVFSQVDTGFVLPEINIVEENNKLGSWLISSNDSTLNTSLLQQLESSTPMHLKTYSPGGNVSFSFHGFGSNHTLMLWNGFPVNSPFLGQPLLYGEGLMNYDKIVLLPGTLSASLFPGGPGTIISAEEKKSLSKTLMLEAGSYQTFKTFMLWGEKLKNFHFKPSISFNQSKNDFHYINNAFGTKNEWFLDRRVNADYQHVDLHIPIFYYTKNKEILSSLWWKNSDMGLPTSIKSPQIPDNERWNENSIRYVGESNFNFQHFNIKPALFFERMKVKYLNRQINLASYTETYRGTLKLDAFYRWNDKIKSALEIYDEVTHAKSNNYQQSVAENHFFIKKKVQIDLSRKWKLEAWNHFILKQWFVPGFQIICNPALNLYCLAGIAKNIHRPTLNDRYWYPGGKPDLKDEEVWTANFHGQYWLSLNSVTITYNSSWFYYQARNWIMWLPDSASSLWKPQNILEVSGKGTDQSVDFFFNAGQCTFKITALVTSQWVFSEKKELLYTPRFRGAFSAELNVKNFITLFWSTIYTGKRFTNFDNTRYMPYYVVHDARLSLNFKKIKSFLPATHFICHNILNVNYQSIAWYPMPRRQFQIQMTWLVK